MKRRRKKIENIQTLDLSAFIGKSYFIDDGSQSNLIFWLVYYTWKRLIDTETIVAGKTKGLLRESIDISITVDSLSLNNSRS